MKTINRILFVVAVAFLVSVIINAVALLVAVIITRQNDTRIHEELGAVIYLPEGYEGEPTRILYWLHGKNQTAWMCLPFLEMPNFIIVSPKFNTEAIWKKYDLKSLVERIETKYPASERYLEGYSRGANGVIFHAAAHPGMFAHVNALAGSYVEKQRVSDPLTIIAGTRDKQWGASSQAYADVVGGSVVWVDSTHNPTEFYGKIKDRINNPVL